MWSFDDVDNAQRMRPSGKDRLLKMKPNGLRRGHGRAAWIHRFCSDENTGGNLNQNLQGVRFGSGRLLPKVQQRDVPLDIVLASFLASIIFAGYWLGLITSTAVDLSMWWVATIPPRWVRIVGQRVDEDIQRRGWRRRIMRQTLTIDAHNLRLRKKEGAERTIKHRH